MFHGERGRQWDHEKGSQDPLFLEVHVPRINKADKRTIRKSPMSPIFPSSRVQCFQGFMFSRSYVPDSVGPMFPGPNVPGSRVLCSQGPKLLRVYIVDNGNIPKGPMFPNTWDLCSLGPKSLVLGLYVLKALSSRALCSQGYRVWGIISL